MPEPIHREAYRSTFRLPRTARRLAVAATLVVAACGRDAPEVEPPPSTPAAVPERTLPEPTPPIAPPSDTSLDEAAAPADVAGSQPDVQESAALPADVLSDVWYETLENGKKTGWTHVRWTETHVDGEPAVHDRTEVYSASTRLMGGVRDTFVSRTVIDLDRTPDGDLITQRIVTTQSGRDDVTVLEWTGTGYTLTRTSSGGSETYTVASAEKVPVDGETCFGAALRAGTVETGARLTFPMPNFLAGRMETGVLAVEARESLALATGTIACWRVHQSVEGRPGATRNWFDEAGVLRKSVGEGSSLIATTESVARDLSRGAATYSITVDARPVLPRCTSLDRSVVELEFEPRDGMELPDFPVTPFSREVAREGQKIRLELRAHDTADATVVLPVTDAAYAEHLRPTALLCSDAEAVRAVVEQVVGDETDGREVARRLLAYVFRSLEKRSGPTPSPNAVEILADGCGDCSEHNVLFVTLCRAAGLPARRLSGYAQVGDMWGAHAFCEIWLGRWVGADPTTNELGTRARYVAFGWNDDPDSFPGLVSTRTTGRVRIRTLEIQEGDEVVDLTQPIARQGRRDPLSGLSIADAPDGWTARIDRTDAAVQISGPGVECSVDVQSGMGDIPAALLKRTMLPSGKVVDFGGHESLATLRRSARNGVWGMYLVPYKRRLLRVDLQLESGVDEAAAVAAIAKILAPTLD